MVMSASICWQSTVKERRGESGSNTGTLVSELRMKPATFFYLNQAIILKHSRSSEGSHQITSQQRECEQPFAVYTNFVSLWTGSLETVISGYDLKRQVSTITGSNASESTAKQTKQDKRSSLRNKPLIDDSKGLDSSTFSLISSTICCAVSSSPARR